MKLFLTMISLTFLSNFIVASEVSDISGCKGVAVKSAIINAKTQFKNRVYYRVSDILDIEGNGHNMISTYDIGLEQCDLIGCGGLSFEVQVKGKKPHCKVLSVELTGEE